MIDWKETCAKCMDGDIEPRHCEYYGEPNGCNSPSYGQHPTTEKSSAVGNAAAMREALVTIRDAARNFCHQILNSKYNDIMDEYKCRDRGFPALLDLRYAIPKANAALSAPARQCDVGTPEEKYKRWVHFCEQRLHSCNNCECKSPVGCTFKFGDMPYIKEGGEA